MGKKNITKLLVTAVAVLLILVTAGCGADPEAIQDEFLHMLDKPVSEESIDSIAVFLDKNLKYMDEQNADNMVSSLEEYAYAFDPDYLQADAVLERYGRYISQPLQELLSLRMAEQENPMSEDAVLKISWKELCARALAVESYINDYKDNESTQKEAVWMYTNYINAMMMGTTGTPTFDYDTGIFNQETLIEYYDITEENPATTVTWVIEEYITYLEGINYQLDYNDAEESKSFFNVCTYLASEAGKRVYQ